MVAGGVEVFGELQGSSGGGGASHKRGGEVGADCRGGKHALDGGIGELQLATGLQCGGLPVMGEDAFEV